MALAREMRINGAQTMQIVKATGLKPYYVSRAVKDIPFDKMAWVETARRLRAEGKSTIEIASIVDRSHTQVVRFCKGVVCPVDHRKETAKRNVKLANGVRLARLKEQRESRPHVEKKKREPALWKGAAIEMRLKGETISAIAKHFDKSESYVGRVVADASATLPKRVAKPKPPREPRVRKIKERMHPLPKKQKQAFYTFVPGQASARTRLQKIEKYMADAGIEITPENVAFEKKKLMLRIALDNDRSRRVPPPVTLPRVTIQQKPYQGR